MGEPLTLNGCLLWQPQRLFKFKLQNEDGGLVEDWLALALRTIPENPGNLDPVLECILVRKTPAAVPLRVFSMGHMVSCAEVIPQIATSTKTGDGRTERWIDISHINEVTWNLC